MRSRWFPALLLLAGTASLASAQVDYVRDVKPIFAKHCYRCHGASQQKGGLRADTVAFLKEGGDTGTSVTPGDARASVLVQVILGTHDDISPMPYKKPPLADAEIAAIRTWIDAGAAAPATRCPTRPSTGRSSRRSAPSYPPSPGPTGRATPSTASSSRVSTGRRSRPRPRPTARRSFAA